MDTVVSFSLLRICKSAKAKFLKSGFGKENNGMDEKLPDTRNCESSGVQKMIINLFLLINDEQKNI